MKKTVLRIAVLFLIVAVFALFNTSMALLLSVRLSNNFSDTSKAGMIRVADYLPHEPSSDLVRIESSLKLTEDLPILDGAAALLPVYAAFVDNVYPIGSVKYEGGSFSDDNYYGENFAEDSSLQYQNTVRGYRAIVDGTVDILFCAAPSEEQLQYAADKQCELVYVPIGREAFVFFVNKNNPVSDLTTRQIRDIYSGKYTNWAELGGADRVINPVTRLAGSGSQSAMDAFMGEKKIERKSPFAIMGASIGFSYRYYMDGIVENDSVKMLSLDGVFPSTENIQNGSYPIIMPFYAIYRADNENENIPLLIEWILSDEGQTIIEESGYSRIQ